MPKNDFIFLGGDLRFIYAAEQLNKTYECELYGFDALDEALIAETGATLTKEIRRRENVVLPLPVSVDCDYITAPYSAKPLPLSEILKAVEPKGTVFCGKECPALRRLCEENSLTLVDYFDREELAVMNAVPTSEAKRA